MTGGRLRVYDAGNGSHAGSGRRATPLCLQAGDGAHIALPGAGMTQKINITVK